MSPLLFESHFFALYKAFLIADSAKALIEGRNRAIIKIFFLWYMAKSLTKSQQELLIDSLIEYCGEEAITRTFAYKCTRRDFEIKEEANAILQNALDSYIKWREALKDEDKEAIALHNIKDRILHYFELKEGGLSQILSPVQNKKSIALPRQLLAEFHNAISHLLQAYEGKRQDNISRAYNHLKRGALDLYKIIIKDFFTLHDPHQEIQERLSHLRRREYSLIGNDKARVSDAIFKGNVGKPQRTLFDEYNTLVGDIISTYLNTTAQPPLQA